MPRKGIVFFVGGRYNFPILFHIKTENTQMVLTSVWMMLGTSNLDHSLILIRETFSEI